MPPLNATISANIPSIVCHLRRRAGIPNNKRQARVAPTAYQGTPGSFGWTRVALVAAVVEMVRIAVPALVPVILTGLVEPKLKVGGYWALVGLEVTAAVSTTLPVKPPLGVTVIVEMFPLVAPGVTETAVPLTVKLGVGATATVTETGAVPVVAM
jgi:hypothetical protein